MRAILEALEKVSEAEVLEVKSLYLAYLKGVVRDSFRSYNALDVTDFEHHRINHSKLFAHKGNHINGIENFWNQAKRHMRRFNGIKKEHFYWFLKESEWRFNGGDHKKLLDRLKHWVKEETKNP